MMRAMLGEGCHTQAQWEELWREHVRLVGELCLRQILWAQTPVAELLETLQVSGSEHLRATLDAGKGAVLLGSHTGNFMGQLLLAGSLGSEAWSFGNPLPSGRAEASFTRFHRRIGVNRMFVRQGRSSGVADLLCRRGLVVTFCDLTTVPRNNAWVPFGRIETLVNLGPALIALRNRAPLLVLVSRVLPAGKTGVWIQPLLPPVHTGDLLRDAFGVTCQAMSIITAEVESHPEQWWNWDLARYRTAEGRRFGWLEPFEIYDFTRTGAEPVHV